MSNAVKDARALYKSKKFKSLDILPPPPTPKEQIGAKKEQIGANNKELKFTITMDIKITCDEDKTLPEAFSNWAGNYFQ